MPFFPSVFDRGAATAASTLTSLAAAGLAVDSCISSYPLARPGTLSDVFFYSHVLHSKCTLILIFGAVCTVMPLLQ